MSTEARDQAAPLREGPLAGVHEELSATFAPFGGWRMPVSYAGTVAEHTAVRENVGIFDVSHLGKALVSGADAARLVDSCLTNDLGRIAPGQAQYTLCCNPSGGVVDDLIAYLVGEGEVFLVPNAANNAEVVRVLRDATSGGGFDAEITDLHEEYAVIAVQGPASGDVLRELGLPTDLAYMAFVDAEWRGLPLRVCRSGYTGELGYEVLPRWDDAETVFRALVAAVRSRGGEVCGLGARDTLRTEMGYPLHGHELSPSMSPLEARCGWAIAFDKPGFTGRRALLDAREGGLRRRLYGLRALDRGVLRAGLEVRAGERAVGVTTSGTFSPTLRAGIALAMIDTGAGLSRGDVVTAIVRGRELRCELVVPPFVDSHVR